MSNHFVQASGLTKSYTLGGTVLQVLKGIDLQLKKGEINFIFGSSGCGKSTLLHMLAGLDRPDQGDVLYDGENIYKLSESNLAKFRNQHIGIVFQFFHLLPELTLLENVMLPMLIARKNDKQKAEAILESVSLIDRRKHLPSQLSGGEKQRAAIARALMNDPDIVFCDEPTGNLDEHSTQEVMALLEQFNAEQNKTFCIVTHEQSLVKGHHTVLELHEGRLVSRAGA